MGAGIQHAYRLSQGQMTQLFQIGNGAAFIFLRADEAHAFDCADGVQLGPFAYLLEFRERHAFGLGDSMHIDEGREAYWTPAACSFFFNAAASLFSVLIVGYSCWSGTRGAATDSVWLL